MLGRLSSYFMARQTTRTGSSVISASGVLLSSWTFKCIFPPQLLSLTAAQLRITRMQALDKSVPYVFPKRTVKEPIPYH